MPEMLKINDGGTMPKRTQAEEATNDLARFMDDWVAWRDTNYVDAEGKPLAKPMPIALHLLREAVETVFAAKRYEVGGRDLTYGELTGLVDTIEEHVATENDRQGRSPKLPDDPDILADVARTDDKAQRRAEADMALRLEVADVLLLGSSLARLVGADPLSAMETKARIVQARQIGPVQRDGIVEHRRSNAEAEFAAIQARLAAD